jgi:hypothetical protein
MPFSAAAHGAYTHNEEPSLDQLSSVNPGAPPHVVAGRTWIAGDGLLFAVVEQACSLPKQLRATHRHRGSLL